MQGRSGGRNGGRRLNVGRVAIAAVILFVLIGGAAALIFGLRGCRTAAVKRSLPFRGDRDYCYTGDGFLYLDGRVLHFYSLNDENSGFSLPVESTASGVIGTDKLKVVYSNSSLQVINTPFDNAITGSLKKIACGSKYVGVYTENDDGTYSLRVFNSAGNQCYRTEYTDTMLLDFGFEGGDSSVLWMSELVLTGNAVTTTVTTYDLNRESITGVISIQGQTVKRIFMTKKSIFAFGTDSVIRFDRTTNEESYRIQCRGYDCVSSSVSGGRLYLLLERTAAEDMPLSVLSLREDASADESVTAVTDVAGSLGCFLLNGKAVVVRQDAITVYGLKGDKERSIPIEGGATGCAKLDEESLLILNASEATLYTVK